jgi:hypothetical protein
MSIKVENDTFLSYFSSQFFSDNRKRVHYKKRLIGSKTRVYSTKGERKGKFP